MKKLYRRGAVHPSPPIVSDHLSFLPATILALAAALSLEDREILAYLISCSNTNNNNNNNNLISSPSSRKTTTANNRKSSTAKGGGGSGGDHPARFNCSCFRCYTSYWVRWDESPNRELIHEIIDAFEDGLLSSQSGGTKAAGSRYGKKDKRNNKRGSSGKGPGQGSELCVKKKDHQLVKPDIMEETNSSNSTDSGDLDGDDESKGSVRRFVSFVGEKIWGGVWSQ